MTEFLALTAIISGLILLSKSKKKNTSTGTPAEVSKNGGTLVRIAQKINLNLIKWVIWISATALVFLFWDSIRDGIVAWYATSDPYRTIGIEPAFVEEYLWVGATVLFIIVFMMLGSKLLGRLTNAIATIIAVALIVVLATMLLVDYTEERAFGAQCADLQKKYGDGYLRVSPQGSFGAICSTDRPQTVQVPSTYVLQVHFAPAAENRYGESIIGLGVGAFVEWERIGVAPTSWRIKPIRQRFLESGIESLELKLVAAPQNN